MCGFVGALGGHYSAEELRDQLSRAAETIVHRGPNDQGVWVDEAAQYSVAHRRLSIQDISASGHQPMASHSGRYLIAFNGEIYNFGALSKELIASGQSFHGHSDTEVLLAAIENWGLERTLERSIGMFAFALWDCKTRTLVLARDRAGEKPLYYGIQSNRLLFGSELKAFSPFSEFERQVDCDALALYLQSNYIPCPHSIYQGIGKLEPGHYVRFQLGPDGPKCVEKKAFWQFRDHFLSGLENEFDQSATGIADQLEELLLDAISKQMISDVPLGAFLSGGIDSSTVVALMQSISSAPVKTFTIGFQEQQYNEAEFAAKVAKHLGTEHVELYVSSSQARDIIPDLPHMYDEPFADSSQIPTSIVSSLASEHVKVALSGDSGDELFCGYSRYTAIEKYWQKVNRIPYFLRKSAGSLVRAVPASFIDSSASVPLRLLSRTAPEVGGRLHTRMNRCGSENLYEFYKANGVYWQSIEQVVHNSRDVPAFAASAADIHRYAPARKAMMCWDTLVYLPDDILAKVDRAAMAHSLEVRVPFLDHRVIEMSTRIPLHCDFHDGRSKWPLRHILYKHVPAELVDRKKMGFAVPIPQWLRGPLREWGEELLEPAKLRQQGFFNCKSVRSRWEQHVRGEYDWSFPLWGVLMFQSWLERSGP